MERPGAGRPSPWRGPAPEASPAGVGSHCGEGSSTRLGGRHLGCVTLTRTADASRPLRLAAGSGPRDQEVPAVSAARHLRSVAQLVGALADSRDAVIVRSTVDLGRNLGLRVVAEGVEDPATWRELDVLWVRCHPGLLRQPARPARRPHPLAPAAGGNARLAAPAMRTGSPAASAGQAAWQPQQHRVRRRRPGRRGRPTIMEGVVVRASRSRAGRGRVPVGHAHPSCCRADGGQESSPLFGRSVTLRLSYACSSSRTCRQHRPGGRGRGG
jgi:hypothetical protein